MQNPLKFFSYLTSIKFQITVHLSLLKDQENIVSISLLKSLNKATFKIL